MNDITKITPRGNDVLFGRGMSGNRHPGNARLHLLVNLFKDDYASATKKLRREIATVIVEEIEGFVPPGRFLALNESGQYIVAEKEKCIDKVLHCLQEMDKRKQSTRENLPSVSCSTKDGNSSGIAATPSLKQQGDIKNENYPTTLRILQESQNVFKNGRWSKKQWLKKGEQQTLDHYSTIMNGVCVGQKFGASRDSGGGNRKVFSLLNKSSFLSQKRPCHQYKREYKRPKTKTVSEKMSETKAFNINWEEVEKAAEEVYGHMSMGKGNVVFEPASPKDTSATMDSTYSRMSRTMEDDKTFLQAIIGSESGVDSRITLCPGPHDYRESVLGAGCVLGGLNSHGAKSGCCGGDCLDSSDASPVEAAPKQRSLSGTFDAIRQRKPISIDELKMIEDELYSLRRENKRMNEENYKLKMKVMASKREKNVELGRLQF